MYIYYLANRSMYSVDLWNSERKQNLNYLKNICEFTPSLLRNSMTARNTEKKKAEITSDRITLFQGPHKIGFTSFYLSIFI
jgi:hypothetical protein